MQHAQGVGENVERWQEASFKTQPSAPNKQDHLNISEKLEESIRSFKDTIEDKKLPDGKLSIYGNRSNAQTTNKKSIAEIYQDTIAHLNIIDKDFIDVSAIDLMRINELLNAEKNRRSEVEQQAIEAQLDRFGNKHKNLIKQADLLAALKLPDIKVPPLHGISSDEVHQFLENSAPEVFTKWEELKTLYSQYHGQMPFLQTEKAMHILQDIDRLIDRAFESCLTSAEAAHAPILKEELLLWLEDMRKQGHYLMVRSTGSEDDKDAANAGGNESIAYVSPTVLEFSRSVGKVVRSYFGAGSLQNQIDMHKNPFDEELKLAVTVQELIGEPIGGTSNPAHIPKSLVLFTNEPLFVGTEKYRVMRINGAYGHGEAVVENRGITTDTVLLLHSQSDPDKLYVFYDNREKKGRLAPIQDPTSHKISLQRIANEPSLVNQRLFDDKTLVQLFFWGILGESFFEDKATDMEIAIKDGIIYPLQARPVVRKEMVPTYLKLSEMQADSPIEQTLKTSMVVPGRASVTEIENSDQILIAESLTEVQEKRLFIKDQHKLVVVAQEEPANSHPVVNFSGFGIPCLCMDTGTDAVKQLVMQLDSSHALAVCVQSGGLHLWNKEIASVAECTAKGFVVHPAKMKISLAQPTKLAQKPDSTIALSPDVKALLFQVQTATTAEVALRNLNALKEHSWIKTLEQRKIALEQQIQQVPLAARTIRPVIQVADELSMRIERQFHAVQASLMRSQADANQEQRLEMLFHAKALDTLLFGDGQQKGAIAQYSLVSLAEHFAAAESQILYQQQLDQPAQFIDELMYGMDAPVEAIFHEWREFLLALETKTNTQLKDTFKQVMATIKQAGVMPSFLVLLFKQALDRQDPIQTAKNIIALLAEKQLGEHTLGPSTLMADIVAQKEIIEEMQGLLDAFGQPETFEKSFEKLKAMAALFHPAEGTVLQKLLLQEHFANQPPLLRAMAIETMHAVVDLYDSAIKALKGSTNFTSDREKVHLFAKMLQPYFQLLELWTTKMVGPDKFNMHWKWTVPLYLERISEQLNNLSQTHDPAQLEPSNGFSVSNAMLGSGTDFERIIPQTLEDVFTLIHQNLLAVISKQLEGLLENTNYLPPLLQNSMQQIKTIGGLGVDTPQRLGIDVKQDQIIMHYNVPLRNHSGRFDLEYHPNGKPYPLKMSAKFLGQARARWKQSSEVIKIFELLTKIPVSKVKVGENEFSYEIYLSDQDAVKEACQIFQMIALYSLAREFECKEIISKWIDSFDLSQMEICMPRLTDSSLPITKPELISKITDRCRAMGAAEIIKLPENTYYALIDNTLADAIGSQQLEVKTAARKLFELLVNKGMPQDKLQHVLEAALSIVKQAHSSQHEKLWARNIFESGLDRLIRESQFELLEDMAGALLNSHIDASKILLALLARGKAFDLAWGYVLSLAKSKSTTPEWVKSIFEVCIDKLIADQNFELLEKTAKTLLSTHIAYACLILEKLVVKEQAVDLAWQVALSLTEKHAKTHKEQAERLLEKCADKLIKDLKFNLLEETASKLLKSHMVTAGIKILQKLLAEGQATHLAWEAALLIAENKSSWSADKAWARDILATYSDQLMADANFELLKDTCLRLLKTDKEAAEVIIYKLTANEQTVNFTLQTVLMMTQSSSFADADWAKNALGVCCDRLIENAHFKLLEDSASQLLKTDRDLATMILKKLIAKGQAIHLALEAALAVLTSDHRLPSNQRNQMWAEDILKVCTDKLIEASYFDLLEQTVRTLLKANKHDLGEHLLQKLLAKKQGINLALEVVLSLTKEQGRSSAAREKAKNIFEACIDNLSANSQVELLTETITTLLKSDMYQADSLLKKLLAKEQAINLAFSWAWEQVVSDYSADEILNWRMLEVLHSIFAQETLAKGLSEPQRSQVADIAPFLVEVLIKDEESWILDNMDILAALKLLQILLEKKLCHAQLILPVIRAVEPREDEAINLVSKELQELCLQQEH